MIIDFHTHVFPDKIASATIDLLAKNANIPAYSNGTLDGLVSKMKEGGVDISIALPVVTKPTNFDSIINFAKALNERFEETHVLSFAGIHPKCENIPEKMRFIKTLGFKGIKIHPDYQGEFIDSAGYIEIVRQAKELDLIVVTHAGFDAGYPGQPIRCTPQRALNLLSKIGGYDKLVFAHMGGNELYDDVYNILAGQNVYLDTSYVLSSIPKDKFNAILEKHGTDKILFATDHPWQDAKENIAIIKDYIQDNGALEKIFFKNAQKLLSL